MLKLDKLAGIFGAVVRPIVLDKTSWPHVDDEVQWVFAGPAVVDVYQEMLDDGQDDLVERLANGAKLAGTAFNSWTPEQLADFEAAVWRSAHRYLLEKIELIDRAPELDEFAKILKIKLQD